MSCEGKGGGSDILNAEGIRKSLIKILGSLQIHLMFHNTGEHLEVQIGQLTWCIWKQKYLRLMRS